MSYLKSLKWEMIVFSLGCIAMGILMAFFPQDVEKIMAICLGILMFIYAIRHAIEYFRRRDMEGFTAYELVLAVIFLIIGIICLTQMNKLITLLAYFVAAIGLPEEVAKLLLRGTQSRRRARGYGEEGKEGRARGRKQVHSSVGRRGRSPGPGASRRSPRCLAQPPSLLPPSPLLVRANSRLFPRQRE